ncbi:hypothetical protein GmHk_17G049171 [Glycine max]|nr:hypothetical protein GmHk_17G049171 [Glycine max]
MYENSRIASTSEYDKEDTSNHMHMEKLEFEELFNNLQAYLGPQVDVVEPQLAELTSQPIAEDVLATISTSSIPYKISPLTTFASTGVSKERIQEMLCLQQANLEETMEKSFLF